MLEKKTAPTAPLAPVTIEADRVLWRGGPCLVINKLPGESSESTFLIAGNGDDGDGGGGGKPWTAAHRLDVPVSGCLLLAHTPEAVAFLSRAFAGGGEGGPGGNVEKRYWAVAEMPPPGAALPFSEDGAWSELVHWLAFDRVRNKSIAYTEKRQNTKKALLRCRLAGRGDHYLFLEIDLLTGRHHQIRAQLAASGLRIKGDLKYGARRSEKEGGIRLHAASLTFPLPEKAGKPQETVTVKAPPPRPDPLWEAVIAVTDVINVTGVTDATGGISRFSSPEP
jgi:23S rRNA pseudouridine1911/1915/1917 synthase